MAGLITKGICYYCNNTFSKSGMTRHLTSCQKRWTSLNNSSEQRATSRLFHLLVFAHYRPMYWLHIEVKANILLTDIDIFLRDIWLECCGHLSQFIINKQHYLGEIIDEYSDKTMDIELGKIGSVGRQFSYEYDFGSTTTLDLKVLSEQEGGLSEEPITLLARNTPPKILCNECQQNIATLICTECVYEGGGWFCNGCATTHECDDDMFLPVVNSPRTGVCGYTG